eukprot:scaffold75433_cov16-Prasinocladus_malaysianus.AAC.1
MQQAETKAKLGQARINDVAAGLVSLRTKINRFPTWRPSHEDLQQLQRVLPDLVGDVSHGRAQVGHHLLIWTISQKTTGDSNIIGCWQGMR